MRDPKRIDEVLEEIRRYWRARPDLRLGQILWNMAGRDPWALEDDALLRRLRGEEVVVGVRRSEGSASNKGPSYKRRR